ncbi:MAG: hypothetical protein K8R02_02080 [Anaerohalosphaeraceae bacterium]|nr:hypothetical protein [Anaerohalosphaeraceae bacterium]
MFENEEQFEKLVKNLKIDDSIDSSHKARLRTKVLLAHDNRGGSFGRFKIVSLSVAAMILVCLTVGRLAFYNPDTKISSARKEKEVAPKSDAPAAHFADSEAKTVSAEISNSRARYKGRPKSAPADELGGLAADVNEPGFVKAIRKMADDGDVAGLVAIAKGPNSTAKFLAIKFLTDIFDANAVEILAALQSPLDVNDPDSPFYQGDVEVADEIVLLEPNEANEPNDANEPDESEVNEPSDANTTSEPADANDANSPAEVNEPNE